MAPHSRTRLSRLARTLLVATLALLFAASTAQAKKKKPAAAKPADASKKKDDDDTDSLDEQDDLPAVQNRLYRNQHEFSVGAGVLPIDAFYKGFSVSGGYGWHITDLFAVEGRFYYMFNFKTSLREDLENNFNIPTSRFDELRWYGQLGLLFKPLYGKLSLLNDSLVYGELYFSVHAAVAQMEGGRATDTEPQGKGQRLAFGGAPGFGLRGYLSKYFSARFDMQAMLLYSAGELHVPLTLTLSIAVTTRTDL
ncbi:MAG: outer membrane beta-barrel domain-containing protein [Myxococcales bacterium]|nr:outer membrane beta-barrel domain-containing protein [Myxococcales bacterium]